MGTGTIENVIDANENIVNKIIKFGGSNGVYDAIFIKNEIGFGTDSLSGNYVNGSSSIQFNSNRTGIFNIAGNDYDIKYYYDSSDGTIYLAIIGSGLTHFGTYDATNDKVILYAGDFTRQN